MLIKHANFGNLSIEKLDVLNIPDKWEEYNLEKIVKIASIQKDKSDLDGFDISAAIEKNPDHLFVKVFAIKKDEVNDNGDAFDEEELKKGASTFIGVPIFCNHQNDDIEKARGKCVHAWYDDKAGGIFIISMIDRISYPPLARGIEEGYINSTSMGVAVGASLCSICHNCSSVADEYCDHVKNRKNKKFSGKVKCQYHNSKAKVEGRENKCPVCGCAKEEEKELIHKEAKIHEKNYNLKFIEDSIVVNPACHDCLIQEVFNVSGLNKKVADLKVNVTKLSSCSTNSCSVGLSKTAGKKELDYLNDAMEKIEKVAKSMMAQKQYVSMEYVSNLVEAMANVQGILDELMEMGYGQLPSPEGMALDDISISNPINSQEQNPLGTGQSIGVNKIPPAAPKNTQVSPSGTAQQSLGDLGSITLPKAASKEIEKNLKNKEEFLSVFGTFKNKLEVLSKSLDNFIENKENNSKELIMATKNSETQDNVKTAEHDTAEITEKQLNNAKSTGERWNSAPETITEKQLDNPTANKDPNVTTSDSPQKRTGSYDVITEKQMASITNGYVARWNDFPEVITEKQWNETSRLIGSALNESQNDRITEKQLGDFLSQHSFSSWDKITEKQLTDQSGDLARWASSKNIVKAAMNAIADTIAFYGKTPQEVIKASSIINQSVKSFDKAAYIMLINALPYKDNERFAEKSKYTYFSKMASSNVQSPNTIDALLVSASDNLEGYKADDIVSAIKVIASSEKGMAQVEDLVKNKMDKGIEQNTTLDKTAEMQNAIAELDRPEDGMYKVYADLKEIGVEPSEDNVKKAGFINALIKFAEKEINDPEVKTALIDANIDEDNKYVVATLKNVNMLTNEEKEAYAQAGMWLDKPEEFDAPASDELDTIEPTDKELDKIEKEPVDDGSRFNIENAIANQTMGGKNKVLASKRELEDWEKFPTNLTKEEHEELLDSQSDSEEYGEPFNVKQHEKEKYRNKHDARKNARDTLVKQAQQFGGQGGPGIGGEAPGGGGVGAGAGAGATLPQPPAAADNAPLESFEQSDMSEGMEDEGAGDEPTPPGTKCPICTSGDVDVLKNESRCNNCGAKWITEVLIRITEGAGLPGEKEEAEDKEEEIPKGLEGGEGFALPEEGAAPTPAGPAPAPGAAPEAMASSNYEIEKYAYVMPLDQKALKIASDNKIVLGSVSPITGSTNTLKISNQDFVCLDTGMPYKVEYAVDKKNAKNVFARWTWNNPETNVECESCKRAKMSFINSLKNYGMTEEEFDSLGMKDRKKLGTTILAMKAKGLLKSVKIASVKDGSIINSYRTKFAAINEKSFPMEMCMQKLANRFGENAVALSGPCEGKPIYDCVCKSLKKAGLYSSSLSAKVADVWMEKEASAECVEDFIRLGFELKQASTICSAMKSKYAQIDDMLAEELENDNLEPIVEEPEDVDVDVDIVEADPFGEDMETGNTVTIELPLDIIEKIDKAIDVATGENPEDEEHHNVEIPDKEVAIDMPSEATDAIDEVVDNTLDEELGTESDDENTEEVSNKCPDCGGDIEDSIETEDTEIEENPIEDIEIKTEEIPEENEDKNMYMKKNEETLENKEGKKCTCGEHDKNDNEGVMNTEETDTKVEKEGEEDTEDFSEKKDCMANSSLETIEKEANQMKPGYVGSSSGHINLDLSGVLAVLKKQAKTPEQKNVQDVKEVGKYKDGKPMKNENALTEKGPTIPDVGEKAKIGNENPPKTNSVDVPSGSELIGGEKDNKALDGSEVTMTGGESGAGIDGVGHRTASVRERISSLADRIIEASEKKLAPKAPVSDDKDIQPIKGDSTIGNESKFTADEVKAKDVKTENDGFIGKEKETFKDKPNDPKDQPSIPAGGGKMGNETLEPEKQEKDKGTVIAESVAKATKLAGRMLTAGRITVDELSGKIEELKSYKLATLLDLEKSLFETRKGLTTVADGMETPIVIAETSNAPKSIADKLHRLFGSSRLGQQNEQAQKLDSDYKKDFGR